MENFSASSRKSFDMSISRRLESLTFLTPMFYELSERCLKAALKEREHCESRSTRQKPSSQHLAAKCVKSE